MKQGQQYYQCWFFSACFWKENGSFSSKNSRQPLTFLVGGRWRGLPYPSPIRYMEKIKGSLEFLLEKEPVSFQKCAKKFTLIVLLSLFHILCLSFTIYYFSTTIFNFFLTFWQMRFFQTTTLRQRIFFVMVVTLYFFHTFYNS